MDYDLDDLYYKLQVLVPSDNQLEEIKNELVKNLDLINKHPNPIKHNVADKVRDTKVFALVKEICNYYPIPSTLFENGYHEKGYFSAEYKNWVLTTYPEQMMKVALNKIYVIDWALENFDFEFCVKLDSYCEYSYLENIFDFYLSKNQYADAFRALELHVQKESDHETIKFSYHPWQNLLSKILKRDNLDFVKQTIKYFGFDLDLVPLPELCKKLESWSIEQAKNAKKRNEENLKKQSASHSYYYSDDDDDDYLPQKEEDNSQVIYKEELKKIMDSLKFDIENGSFVVYHFFFEKNLDLSGKYLTEHAIGDGNIELLENLKSINKLDYDEAEFSDSIHLPLLPNNKIKELVNWLTNNEFSLFSSTNKREKSVSNVQNEEIANYFLNLGFNRIIPVDEWGKTVDYIRWCLAHDIKINWYTFVNLNYNLEQVLEGFELAHNKGVECSYIKSIEKDTIFKGTTEQLNRLMQIGYPFLDIEWFTLQIYCPTLTFLKFFVEKCLLKNKNQGNEAIKKCQSKRLYQTTDLEIQNYLYDTMLYDHDRNKKFEHSQYSDKEFDMWTYALESNDFNLIKWVHSKGYQMPSRNYWVFKPKTREFLDSLC